MEIKPCECGYLPKVGYSKLTPRIRFKVKCFECGEETEFFKSSKEAIQAWNSRKVGGEE
jgi:ribosomal protein S27E